MILKISAIISLSFVIFFGVNIDLFFNPFSKQEKIAREHYATANFASGLDIYNDIYSQNKKNDDGKLLNNIAIGLSMLGTNNQGTMAEAEKKFLSSINIAKQYTLSEDGQSYYSAKSDSGIVLGETYYNLGIHYLMQNDLPKARGALIESLKWSAEDISSKEALELVLALQEKQSEESKPQNANDDLEKANQKQLESNQQPSVEKPSPFDDFTDSDNQKQNEQQENDSPSFQKSEKKFSKKRARDLLNNFEQRQQQSWQFNNFRELFLNQETEKPW